MRFQFPRYEIYIDACKRFLDDGVDFSTNSEKLQITITGGIPSIELLRWGNSNGMKAVVSGWDESVKRLVK